MLPMGQIAGGTPQEERLIVQPKGQYVRQRAPMMKGRLVKAKVVAPMGHKWKLMEVVPEGQQQAKVVASKGCKPNSL